MIPQISILVPIFNAEQYLRQCLDSLVQQTQDGIEIICLDDGSTDSSPQILKDYSAQYDNIRIISKNNSGYGDTLNTGIELSQGEYIGIVEPDDYVDAKMFQTLFENAKNNDLDVSRCTFFNVDEITGETTEEKFSFVIKNKVYSPRNRPEVFYQQPTDWICLYKKSFLDTNGIRFLPTPGASYQDTSFMFKVYASADRFMMCDKPLYYYRINNNSSVKIKTSKIDCICKEYAEIWEFVRNKNETDHYKYIITQLQFYGYKWNCIRLDEECRKTFLQIWKKELIKQKQNSLIRRFDYIPSDYKIIKNVMKYNEK